MSPLVGLISDTHGLLRPEAVRALSGADHIIHAGDIGRPSILAELQIIAPVTAVRGNVDRDPWALRLPKTAVLQIARASIYVIHDIGELDLLPEAAGFAAVVFGHSHRPSLEQRRGVTFVNPGSAGPARFNLPISLARMPVTDGAVEIEFVTLR
jgi:uncharacterized protein